MALESREQHAREERVKDEALSQCLSVNPDNPLAVAETIKEAFETLKQAESWFQTHSNSPTGLSAQQLGCNCPDCDGCLIMAEVLGKIPTLNARIEAGVREIYNQYSPSWQHTRNQPGSKF